MLRELARDYATKCFSVRLRRLNRVVTNLYDEALRPLGVKCTQLHILIVIANLGVARPGEVSRVLSIDASTLSRNLERMRKRGWLEAVTDRSDARLQPVRITEAGERLLNDAYPLWQQAQRQAQEIVGPEALEALLESGAAQLGDPSTATSGEQSD